MAWLEPPITERDARRLALVARNRASNVRDDLVEQLAALAHQAKDLAQHTRDVVEPRFQQAREIVRREAPVVADAAVHQALRAAKAARRDPVPVLVGAVGIALVASLLFSRRRT
jgi:ElaB/YqjD/DUF883 family membrane-anchored ribosome-binding protein